MYEKSFTEIENLESTNRSKSLEKLLAGITTILKGNNILNYPLTLIFDHKNSDYIDCWESISF